MLINNAGINPGREDIVGAPLEQVRRAYETNVFGLIAVTQAFLPALGRSAQSRIVNISSGTGSLGLERGLGNPQFDWERVHGGGLAYRSSKTAVNAVTYSPPRRWARGSRSMRSRRDCADRPRAGEVRRRGPAKAATGAVRLGLMSDDGPTGALWSWDGGRVLGKLDGEDKLEDLEAGA